MPGPATTAVSARGITLADRPRAARSHHWRVVADRGALPSLMPARRFPPPWSVDPLLAHVVTEAPPLGDEFLGAAKIVFGIHLSK